MENSRENVREISLMEIYKVIVNNIGKIIGTTLVGIVLSALLTFLVITPIYESDTFLVVNDQQTDSAEAQLDQSTLQTNLSLLNTYQSIIEQPIILQPVIDETGADLTVEQLAAMTEVTVQNNSLVFSIAVQSESPFLSADLANAIATQFSEQIHNILNVTNVTVLTQAVPNSSPVSPSVPINLIIGALIGAVVGVLWFIAKAIFDRSVQSEEIITDLGWTLLGSIPQMEKSAVKDTRFKQEMTADNSRSRRV